MGAGAKVARRGAGPNCRKRGASPASELPDDCWHHVLEYLDPSGLTRAGSVNKTLRNISGDDCLWQPYFEPSWSPEHCGLQTPKTGKVFRTLYSRWQRGEAGTDDIIWDVHGKTFYTRCDPKKVSSKKDRAMHAVQLSNVGGLAAWSVGADGALVCTDVTTCQTRSWVEDAYRRSAFCLAIFDTLGMVCTNGHQGCISGWDPRQLGAGVLCTPAFTMDCQYVNGHPLCVMSMLSHEAPRGDGQPQLVTGPLAIDTHHGTLLGGGYGGDVFCWDLDTGAHLSTLKNGAGTTVAQLVVGKECLLSLHYNGKVFEWVLPDPKALVDQTQPKLVTPEGGPLSSPATYIPCMQGLGEGPAGVLCGTENGRIRVVGRPNKGLPLCGSLGDPAPQYHRCHVSCLAATDQVVVTGYQNGSLRVMRLDTPLGA